MSGTKQGGRKTATRMYEIYGSDYYRNIGRKGGRNGHMKGFALNPELAKVAGRKGGQKSRRGKAKKVTQDEGE